jgi:chromosome partitioning protein
MMVVSLQSQKGGAGKTTLAVNLAVAAEKAGLSTVIIDLDPQSSAGSWGDLRSSDRPTIAPIPPGRLPQALQTAETAGAGLVLIDTAPATGDVALAAARAADLILIPCRPALFDIKAIGATADIARIAGKPAYVVLNAAPPVGTRLVEDARQAIAAHGLAVVPIVISQRASFARAITDGLSVQEHEPGGKAANEIGELYKWLRRRARPSKR